MYVRPDERKNRRRTKVTRFDVNFEERVGELKRFRERFGHCNVPQHWKENPSLGRWVIRQRVYQEYLSAERYDQLKHLGFVFRLPDYWWEKRYTELTEYHRLYGHCEVPKGTGKYESLAEWVGKQRRDFKMKFKRLTKEKIDKLNQLGFYWGRINASWEQRFEELKTFRERFGHCQVPSGWKENPPLSWWVAIQSLRYKQVKLSYNRYKLLESIGFVWEVGKRMRLD